MHRTIAGGQHCYLHHSPRKLIGPGLFLIHRFISPLCVRDQLQHATDILRSYRSHWRPNITSDARVHGHCPGPVPDSPFGRSDRRPAVLPFPRRRRGWLGRRGDRQAGQPAGATLRAGPRPAGRRLLGPPAPPRPPAHPARAIRRSPRGVQTRRKPPWPSAPRRRSGVWGL